MGVINFNKKNKKKMQQPVAPNSIDLIRFTKEAWLTCYPESNAQEWEENQILFCNSDFIATILSDLETESQITTENLETIRMIVLDDEYCKYLEKIGEKDTPQTRAAYDLPDDKAEELVKKYGFTRDYHLLGIPVTAFAENGKETYSLSMNTIKAIRVYMGNIFGEKNMWFPGYLMDPEALYGNQEKLVSMSAVFFEEGKLVSLGAFKSLEPDVYENGTMFFIAYMPIVVRGTRDHAILQVDDDDIYRDHPDEHMIDLVGSGILKMLKKDFETENVFTEAMMIYPENIADHLQMSVDAIFGLDEEDDRSEENDF